MKANKLFFVIIIIFFVSKTISAQENNFIYKSDQGKCQITFPSEYKIVSNIEANLPTTKVKADFNDNVYFLKFSIHKTDAVTEDNTIFVNSTAESFVSGIKGTNLEKTEIKTGNHAGIDMTVSMNDKPLFVHYRTFLANRIQYQYFVISKSKEKTEEINNFLNSFQITTQ
jgi:hypothetical protein